MADTAALLLGPRRNYWYVGNWLGRIVCLPCIVDALYWSERFITVEFEEPISFFGTHIASNFHYVNRDHVFVSKEEAEAAAALLIFSGEEEL